MSRLWQQRTGRAFSKRRASVDWSARAVVLRRLAHGLLCFKASAPLPCTATFSNRGSHPGAGIACHRRTELIYRSASRKVRVVRPSPNPNTSQKVSTRRPRVFGLPSCAFGSVGALSLPVAGFGTRGRPNYSFKRTRLRRAA